jgi:hypothetical protein
VKKRSWAATRLPPSTRRLLERVQFAAWGVRQLPSAHKRRAAVSCGASLCRHAEALRRPYTALAQLLNCSPEEVWRVCSSCCCCLAVRVLQRGGWSAARRRALLPLLPAMQVAIVGSATSAWGQARVPVAPRAAACDCGHGQRARGPATVRFPSSGSQLSHAPH